MPVVGASTSNSVSTPSGGASGQYVVKASAKSMDFTFAPPSVGVGAPTPYLTGTWYDTRASLMQPSANQTWTTAPTCRYIPFFLANPLTISQIGVYVSSGSGYTAYLGVNTLSNGTTGKPGTLLGQVSTGVVSTTGACTRALSLTIPAGWNFAAVGSTTSFIIAATTDLGSRAFMGSPQGPDSTTTNSGSAYQAGWQSAAASAVPASNPSVTAFPYNNNPVVWFCAA